MANTPIPISALPSATTLAAGDLVPVVTNSTTSKMTATNLIKSLANLNNVVSEFGAKGDAVLNADGTVASGTDDTTAIQTAFSNGKLITFPGGTAASPRVYKVTDDSSLDLSKVSDELLVRYATSDLAEQWTGLRGVATDGVFLHFNLSTFLGNGTTDSDSFGTGAEPVTTYAPTAIDVDQWLDTIKSLGMAYAVLVAKHTNGFCLWPTATTPRSVGNGALRGTVASMDVVRAFCDGCRARGLKVGIYFSVGDLTASAQIGGDPDNPTRATAWMNYVKAQLAELLGNYGQIDYLFMDTWNFGAWTNYITQIPYATVYSYIKSLQPNCLVVPNNHYTTAGTPWTASLGDVWEFELYVTIAANDAAITVGQTTYPVEQNFTTQLDGSSQVKWFFNANDVSQYTFLSYGQFVNDLRSRNVSSLVNLPPGRDGVIHSGILTPIQEWRNLLRVRPLNYGKTAASTSNFSGSTLPGNANQWIPNLFRLDSGSGKNRTPTFSSNIWSSAVGDNNPAWTGDLGSTKPVYDVIAFNRLDLTALDRFQNIYIDLLASDGTTLVATSGKLNINNALSSPDYLRYNFAGAQGRYVRVRKAYNGTDSGGAETLALSMVYIAGAPLNSMQDTSLDSLIAVRSGGDLSITVSHTGASALKYRVGEQTRWSSTAGTATLTGMAYNSLQAIAVDSAGNVLAEARSLWLTKPVWAEVCVSR